MIREGVVEKLVSGGDGLVRLDGLVVFVSGAVEGERVRVLVGPVQKGHARGEVLERLSDSPNRRQPPCPWYGECGGCDLMHLTEEAQAHAKISWVVESFGRLAGLKIDRPVLIQGSPWAYRSRLQLHKSSDRWGFHAQGSDAIVAVERCRVAVDEFLPWWPSAAEFLPLGRTGVFATSEGVKVQGRDEVVTLMVRDRPLVSSLDGFFQSNLELLPRLIEDVLESFPGSGGRLLDLYGGVGLFGAFLADKYSVVVVESNPSALSLAKKNVRGPGHEFHALSLEDWWRLHGRHETSLAGVVVDPPRAGLSKSARLSVSKLPTRRLTYVSCNPDTLARDAREFVAGGWTLEVLKLFDFYPQTHHVEAVARFVRP